MKLNKRFFTGCLLAVLCIVTAPAQTKKEKQEQKKQELKEKISSNKFVVDVNTAYPRRGKTVHLTSSYSVEIKNDSVFSRLPYYGRAYSIPYGGGKGLMFEVPINDYNVDYNKKGMAKITFKARTNEDFYRFTIEIYPGGSSNIDVNMTNRDGIDFIGQLKEEDEEK